ncbi:hypothetical protein E0F15_21655 [Frankia sp. B2]|uniref:PfkB family carbohydrate kinase n=1 Tax=unclassified Frankia TaxID=2632575 RepID=UPI000460F778|nr:MULTISPECIES: PfkB family carbohydrate kinase [unclassified Frankia]KDA40595.1 sugar kinase, ribokinase [Frankia sp. BMG5.23]TFE24459.1 hypothetical protein E0F15_21655 [Frankia sp. B2]
MLDEPRSTSPPAPLDIVGIGALNLDYLADAAADSGLRRLLLDGRLLTRSGDSIPITRGAENAVADGILDGILAHVEPTSLTASFGGSAFNTIYALSQLGLGLQLGFIGVAGSVPPRARSGVAELQRVGVDTDKVEMREDAVYGACLSLLDGSERTLLTHAGANVLIGDIIDQRFDELLTYLRRARVVHVTSFFDPVRPPRLLKLLAALRAIHPDVVIMFDPGHAMSAERSEAVLGPVGLSDYLLLNAAEMTLLGQAGSDEHADDIVARILDLAKGNAATVVVKRPTGITIHRRSGRRITSRLYPQRCLGEKEIRDSTGAGDVFAAGLLSMLCDEPPRPDLGVSLGMLLARHKLQHIGTNGHAGFASLVRRITSGGESDTGL